MKKKQQRTPWCTLMPLNLHRLIDDLLAGKQQKISNATTETAKVKQPKTSNTTTTKKNANDTLAFISLLEKITREKINKDKLEFRTSIRPAPPAWRELRHTVACTERRRAWRRAPGRQPQHPCTSRRKPLPSCPS